MFASLLTHPRVHSLTLYEAFGPRGIINGDGSEFPMTELFDQHQLDFVDIVSTVESHALLADMAMQHGVAAICQKPLAESLEVARELCDQSRALHVPLMVHEKWRWQTPIRRLKAILDSGNFGPLVRARIDFANSFPVFDNQPALKALTQFILADIGTHILDISRFLFGEAVELYCQTRECRSKDLGSNCPIYESPVMPTPPIIATYLTN